MAVARELALSGREVLILERAGIFGSETSSRNSEVIHAGIYYDRDSLMARFCVEGRHDLYKFCAEKGVEHRRCGKLIVATDAEELGKLEAIKARALANGVDDLEVIDRSVACGLEPALSCTGALSSPSTGIVDSHGYMLALLADAEAHGASLAYNAPVTSGRIRAGGMELDVGGSEPTQIVAQPLHQLRGACRNSRCEQHRRISCRICAAAVFRQGQLFLARGSFAILQTDLSGAGAGRPWNAPYTRHCRHGAVRPPMWSGLRRFNYSVKAERADQFYASIRRYWPGLKDGALQPAYCGIRPKIVPPAIAKQDFVIQGPDQHGVDKLHQSIRH